MNHAPHDDPDAATFTGRVLEVQRRTRGIAVIRVHCPEPVPYLVGQHIPVRSPTDPDAWRYLSPALPPNPEGLLEFHVRIVDGGAVSRALAVAPGPGDVLHFGRPRGFLGEVLDDAIPTGRHHRRNQRPRGILMVAGGTGLAPMRAIAMEAADLPEPPPIHLVWGARSPGELYDLRFMTELARNLPNLTLTTCVDSRTDAPRTRATPFSAHPRAPMPRLGVACDVAARMHRDDGLGEMTVLVAGPPAMIAATRDAVIRAGADPNHVHHDPVGPDPVGHDPVGPDPVAQTTASRAAGSAHLD